MTTKKIMQRRPVTHTVRANPLADLKNDLAPVYGEDKKNTKHAGGRPTKYTPEMCSKVIELGKEGYTKEEMVLELGLSKQTLYNWCTTYPEFLDAIEEAVFLGQGYMEKLAREALKQPANAFNTTLWGKIVSARFPDTYREITRREHSGPDKTPIPVEIAAAPLTGEGLKDYYKSFMDRSRRNGLPV